MASLAIEIVNFPAPIDPANQSGSSNRFFTIAGLILARLSSRSDSGQPLKGS